MATQIVSLNELDEFFANFAEDVLGLPPERIVISYQDKGQVHFKWGFDYCFVHTSEQTDEIQMFKDRSINYELSNCVQSQKSTRRIQVEFVLYGPNCDVNSIKLKEMMYFEKYRLLFADNGMSLISNSFELENKIHERINERFWERADLTVDFYDSVNLEEELPYIEGANVKMFTNLSNEEI